LAGTRALPSPWPSCSVASTAPPRDHVRDYSASRLAGREAGGFNICMDRYTWMLRNPLRNDSAGPRST
jgi:hypothetical protein